jgi:multidrug efflux pump subunit AcrA (membrane-fusion protein)
VVGSVEPVVDAGSATFRVRIIVPNEDHKIVAGVPATAAITLASIPSSALRARAPGNPPATASSER